jgi:hypothetical protein
MAGKGGYQPPAKPAPSSGPGPLSKRTDGGPAAKRQPIRELPNAEYGEAQEFRTNQQAAPMAASAGGGQVSAPPPVDPTAGVVGFGAPSQMPDQPVTAGADAGLGPDSSALGIPDPSKADIENLKRVLPALELVASGPNSSQATRNVVRRLRSLTD